MELQEISNILIDVIKKSKKDIIEKQSINNIQKKSYQDYVTNLDIEIENYLISELSNKLQNISIFSEEKIKNEIDISDINCIVIDPLDGTLNAISHLDFYAISIAYLENGLPKIGITYDFKRDEIFYAIENLGFFINNQKISHHNQNKSNIIAISNDFLIKAIEQKSDIIKNLRKFGKIRILGSQTLHLAYVAAGKVKFNINFEAKFWDDAAGYVMLKEAGLNYKNFSGKNIFPKIKLNPKENLLSVAGNESDLNEVKKLIKGII